MSAIEVLKKGQLSGSGYIEFLPGKFNEEHWNDNSIYVAWGGKEYEALEGLIREFYSGFDPYAPNEIEKEIWIKILEKLPAINLSQKFSSDMSGWVTETLKENECISVLGV